MSPILSPALAKTLRVASMGPVSISVGSEPTVVKATTRALARNPRFFAVSPLINSNAAAPSEICDELPAVMRPVSGRKLVFSVESLSREVSRRMVSSRSSVLAGSVNSSSRSRSTATGTISFSK
ncbi:hypothetical protein D9M71_683890 [compost metagenome]